MFQLCEDNSNFSIIHVYLSATSCILHGRQKGPGSVEGVEPRGRVQISNFFVPVGVTAENVNAFVHAHG